jgi:hypothetical protein
MVGRAPGTIKHFNIMVKWDEALTRALFTRIASSEGRIM